MCYLKKQNNAHSDKYQSPAHWVNPRGCGDGQMKTKLSWTKQNKNLTQQKWPHVHRFHQTHIWSITIAQKYICTRLAHTLRNGFGVSHRVCLEQAMWLNTTEAAQPCRSL